MAGATPDIPALLRELTELAPEQRIARLRGSSDIGTLVLALADEVERLAISENARAVEAGLLVEQLAELCCGALERTRALRARGQALAYAGRFEEALSAFNRAVAAAEQDQLDVDAARARMSSMHALGTLGRLDEAVAAGRAAHTAFSVAGEAVLAARAAANLGTIFQFKDEPATALEYLSHARAVMQSDVTACAQLDSNRARAMMSLNDFAAAEATYKAALPAFEQAEMSWAAAIVEGNLADLATRQGRLQAALYHFERAIRHLERDDAAVELARLRTEQAEALTTMGMLEEACEAYRSALPELERQGATLEVMRAKAGLGRALVRLQRFDAAEPVLAAAADLMLIQEQPRESARLDLYRAEIAAARRDFTAARDLVQRSIERLSDRGAEVAAAQHQLAHIALQEDDPAQAIEHVARALPVAENLDLAPLRADLLYCRGIAHRERGETIAAVADLREAVEQVERIRGSLQAERFRSAFHRNQLTLYEDLVTTALDSRQHGSIAEAFAAVERAKGRSLLDLVQRAVDLPDVLAARTAGPEAELAAELNRTRAELNAFYSRLADAAGSDTGAAGSDQLRAEIRRRERALETLEGRLATTGAAAGLYARPVGLDTAQALVGEDSALVEYFTAGDEVLAFVLRPGRVRVFRRIARAADLADRTRRVHFQIRRALRPGDLSGPRAARLLDDVQLELRALEQMIYSPLRAAIDGAARITFVPHGPLHTAPLHALWDGQRYLAEEHEITVAPSASMLARLPAAALPQHPDALVVGVADELAPEILDEARRVAHTLAAGRVLINQEADVDRVVSAASGADIIHVAAHGHYTAENPLASGLKLADRWMNVRDIYGMRLRCGLLTLSGCETGRTQVAGGDDLLGLVRGFLAAGAGALLVSLWSVNDQSTAEWMTEFYSALRGPGARPASALRAAQRAMLERRPHPAMWAPFVLVGRV